MTEQRVTVGCREGLHARPAAVFVKAAGRSPVPIYIGRVGASPVPAASLVSVLSLAVNQGEDVVLSADGDGAEAVLAQLAAGLRA